MGVPMLLSDLDVHREQMGDGALYFNRHSAESLADTLQQFQPLDDAQRQAMIDDARIAAAQRVTRFGEEFIRLAESCIKRRTG